MDEKLQELLNRVRETANQVSDMASSGMRYAGQRAEEMISITKVNMEIFDLNTEVNLLLREVGEMVYATHCGGETNDGLLMEKLAAIDEKKSQIEALKAQAGSLRGTKTCSACGAVCEKGDMFCRTCGQKL